MAAGETPAATAKIPGTLMIEHDGRESLPYASARREFRTGDLLCFRGRGAVSWAIRALTRSPYSHAGVVYRLKDRVFSLEAIGIGVRLILMSELVKRYHGGIDYFAVQEVTDPQREQAIDFAFAQLGKLYDRRGVARFLWFLLTGRRHRSRERSYWYCSEIVAEAYRQAGAELAHGTVGYVSPAAIAGSERVRFVFRVKRA